MKKKLTDCPRCNGTGIMEVHNMSWKEQLCTHCLGNGEVDWIEAIVGVKEENGYKDVPPRVC